ncbi:MAG: hypothetical protein IPQ09_30570 [Myxococcales bacterium]|nr:hypothetical protein [Myxococcales bacterium]
MTTSLRLHALFASLLGATAVTVGCSGAIAVEPDAGADAGVDGALTDGALPDGATPDARPPGDGGTLPPFALSVCLSDDERSYLFPKDATLASGVQFLGGYELSGDSKPTGMKPSTHKVGLACSKANDPTACSTALDAFEPATPYWSACQGFCPPFPARQVRTTSGDTVAVIGKREDVKKGFLPIDTPTEAVAAVEARHYVACESGKNNVLQHADGTFSVKVIDAQCAQDPKDPTKSYDTVDEISFRVTPAGVVTEEARVRVKEQPTTGCPVAGRKPAGLEPANTQSEPRRGRPGNRPGGAKHERGGRPGRPGVVRGRVLRVDGAPRGGQRDRVRAHGRGARRAWGTRGAGGPGARRRRRRATPRARDRRARRGARGHGARGGRGGLPPALAARDGRREPPGGVRA